MRCTSEESTSSTATAVAGDGGVCGTAEVDQEDLSAFCSSLQLLDSPYTCEDVSRVVWALAKVGCVQQQAACFCAVGRESSTHFYVVLLLEGRPYNYDY